MKKKMDLYIVYFLMMIYSYNDVMNSASAGNETDARGTVYVFLVAVVLAMVLFVLRGRYVPKSGMLLTLLLFTGYYILDVFYVKGTLTWGTFVYLGLSVWWCVIIVYFQNIVMQDINVVASIRKFVRIMYIGFTVAILYGSANISSNYSIEFARVGYIYHILSMFPLILLTENNKMLKRIFMLSTILLAVFSFKRGAIIVAPIMIIGYFITENIIGTAKNSIVRILILGAIFFVSWQLIDEYSGGYLSERFSIVELSDGSGRSELIEQAMDNVSIRNSAELLLGIKNKNEVTMEMGPHNEWVGHLYSYGVIGVMFYALIFICLLMNVRKLLRKRSIMAPSYMAVTLYACFIGLVSGLYFVHSTFYIMLYLAVVQGMSHYREENVKLVLQGVKTE